MKSKAKKNFKMYDGFFLVEDTLTVYCL